MVFEQQKKIALETFCDLVLANALTEITLAAVSAARRKPAQDFCFYPAASANGICGKLAGFHNNLFPGTRTTTSNLFSPRI